MNIILQSLDFTLPLALISLIASLIIIAFGTLFGAIRGVHRSAIRIAAVIIALVAAFFIAIPQNADEIYSQFVLYGADLLPDGVEIPAALFGLITSYASAIIAPIAFLVSFIVLAILLSIVFGIVAICIFPGKKYNKAKAEETGEECLPRVRWAGALIGAVSSIIVVAALNLPVYGYAELATKSFAPVLAEVEDSVIIENENTLADTFTKLMFGDKMFDRLTTTTLHGEKMRFSEHADNISKLVVSAIHITTRPISEWEDQEREALGFFFDVATEDVFGAQTTTIIADGVQTYLKDSDIIGQALEKSPAIKTAFENVINDLDHNEKESFNNLLHATEEIVLISVDAIQQSEDGTLDAKKFITDGDIAKDTITVIVTTPELDAVTLASVDFGLEKMAQQMGLEEIGHVDVEAWNNITDEEREKEAELLATIVPQVVEFKTDENGVEHMSFNYEEAMLGLRESVLVGEIVEDALEDIAANYVEDVKNGNVDYNEIPDFVWDIVGELDITIPAIPGL